MHRFTDFKPQVRREPYEPEPTLFDIIAHSYGEMDDPQAAAKAYIEAWLALERAESHEMVCSWDEWGDRHITRCSDPALTDDCTGCAHCGAMKPTAA